MGKIALVFAGQGAQKPGMGKGIYQASLAARAVMDAAEALRPGTLGQCFGDDPDALLSTLNVQPCVFIVDMACAAAVREAGVPADCVAGFSLGELAAACFAGMMPFESAFQLVMRRAGWMQACAERYPGGMLAVIRLDVQQVEALCAEFEGAYPVNYNAPGQTVVACSADLLEPVSKRVAAAGGRAIRLNVSGAFHSPYMEEAAAKLAEYLRGTPLAPPEIPLYSNKTARPYAGDCAALMASQAASPVQWQQTIESMVLEGVDTFVEVGPGAVLTGLIKKIDRSVTAINVEDAEGLTACRARILGG